MTIKVYLMNTEKLNVDDARIRHVISAQRMDKLCAYKADGARKNSCGAELLLCLHMAKAGDGKASCRLPLCIERESNGKPYLRDGSVFFSFSHSGSYAVCAVGDISLGADTERLRELPCVVTRRFYAEGDHGNTPIHIWSAKEAYLKFTGDGLCGGISLHDTVVKKNCVENRITGEKAWLWQYVYAENMLLSVCAAEKFDVETEFVDSESIIDTIFELGRESFKIR